MNGQERCLRDFLRPYKVQSQEIHMLKPKTPCKACLESAWRSLQKAIEIPGDHPTRVGAMYCHHEKVLVYFVNREGEPPSVMCTTGLTAVEAIVAYGMFMMEHSGSHVEHPGWKDGFH